MKRVYGPKMAEADLQRAIAKYIRMKYPAALFHSDFGSGIKLQLWQAVAQKAQNGGRRAWPDMFIAEPVPRCVDGSWNYEYNGLFMELKREGTRLKKKNGEWSNQHIAEQADMLEKLEFRGYKAIFAVGYEEAKRIVDEYLGMMGVQEISISMEVNNEDIQEKAKRTGVL